MKSLLKFLLILQIISIFCEASNKVSDIKLISPTLRRTKQSFVVLKQNARDKQKSNEKKNQKNGTAGDNMDAGKDASSSEADESFLHVYKIMPVTKSTTSVTTTTIGHSEAFEKMKEIHSPSFMPSISPSPSPSTLLRTSEQFIEKQDAVVKEQSTSAPSFGFNTMSESSVESPTNTQKEKVHNQNVEEVSHVPGSELSLPLTSFTIFITTKTSNSDATTFDTTSFYTATRNHLISIFEENLPEKYKFHNIYIDMEANELQQVERNNRSGSKFKETSKFVEEDKQINHICDFQSKVEIIDTSKSKSKDILRNFDYLIFQAFEGENESRNFFQVLTTDLNLNVINMKVLIDSPRDQNIQTNSLLKTKTKSSGKRERHIFWKTSVIAIACIVSFSIMVSLLLSYKKAKENKQIEKNWRYDATKEAAIYGKHANISHVTSTEAMDLGIPIGNYEVKKEVKVSENKSKTSKSSTFLQFVPQDLPKKSLLDETQSDVPLSDDPYESSLVHTFDNVFDLITSSMKNFLDKEIV